MKKNYKKIDRYELITNQVIELMEKQGTDWIKTWGSNVNSNQHNKFNKKSYNGTNVFLTCLSAYVNGFTSNQWGSYKQWKDKGYQVKKGSKGTPIIYYSKIEIKDKENEEVKTIPILKGFSVFNGNQIENYTPPKIEKEKSCFNHNKTDRLIESTKAIIKQGGNKAFYSPSADFIQMPFKQDFKGCKDQSAKESYYNTLLHELSHWTGHKTRLDRSFKKFGSNAYAFEELIAECSSVFLCGMLGINNKPNIQNAKYLNNWLEVLKNDKKAMIKAFSQAQKASDYILAFSNELKKAA